MGGGPHVRMAWCLVCRPRAGVYAYVNVRVFHPFSSVCFCMCASFRIAHAPLHEACQHHSKVMSKGFGQRSWAIRESSARRARAEILVYIYIW